MGKSCAELAPYLIRSALGESPLAENVNTLAHKIGPRVSTSLAAVRAEVWAVGAFQRAGADEVHTETFRAYLGQKSSFNIGSSENVVAEIRGYEKSSEFVLIGGRLGSQGSPEDSLASAEAVAALIDAVRVIHSSGSIPRRTIRFVLLTASEQGMQGPEAYVRAHQSQLSGLIAAVFFEPGAGAIRGYSLDGRGDTLTAVRAALEPAAQLGVKELTVDAVMSANNLDFILEGVPTLVARQEASAQVPASQLTPEVLAELKRHSAVAAITAYALADGEGRIGARQTRPEIEQLLKNTGLDQKMKAADIWPAWASGERGRQK